MTLCVRMGGRSKTFFSRGMLIGAYLLVSGCLLQGCVGWSQSELTKLDLRMTASADLNPDISGRPSPLVVRLYELKAPSTFENADFFSLYDYDKETLGSDFIVSEEMTLKPGRQFQVKLALNHETNYVAVMGAYRDVSNTNWRRIFPVAIKNKNRKNLVFSSSGIAVLE